MYYIGTFVEVTTGGTCVKGQVTETTFAHYAVKMPDGYVASPYTPRIADDEIIVLHSQVAALSDQASPRCKCGELVRMGFCCFACGRSCKVSNWWLLEDTAYCRRLAESDAMRETAECEAWVRDIQTE